MKAFINTLVITVVVSILILGGGAVIELCEGPAQAQSSHEYRKVRALESIASELQSINRNLERKCR